MRLGGDLELSELLDGRSVPYEGESVAEKVARTSSKRNEQFGKASARWVEYQRYFKRITATRLPLLSEVKEDV